MKGTVLKREEVALSQKAYLNFNLQINQLKNNFKV